MRGTSRQPSLGAAASGLPRHATSTSSISTASTTVSSNSASTSAAYSKAPQDHVAISDDNAFYSWDTIKREELPRLVFMGKGYLDTEYSEESTTAQSSDGYDTNDFEALTIPSTRFVPSRVSSSSSQSNDDLAGQDLAFATKNQNSDDLDRNCNKTHSRIQSSAQGQRNQNQTPKQRHRGMNKETRENSFEDDGDSDDGDDDDFKNRRKAVTREISEAGSSEATGKNRNAANCRRFREKRKRNVQELREKHEELLADKREFEHRIEELQTEVDLLRHAGGAAVDLRLENELLRLEVKRHRVFVENVVRAGMQNRPAEVSTEEAYRVLRGGVDATAGMMHGLLYTSASDPSWKEAQPIGLPNGKHLRLRYQYLPVGSTPETARRLNLRIDAPPMDAPLRFVYEAIKHPYVNKDHMNHARFGVIEDILPQDVAALAESVGDPIQMYQYREAESLAEMVLTSSSRKRSIFSAALLEDSRADLDDGEVYDDSTLLVQCSSPSSQLSKADVIGNSTDNSTTRLVEAPLLLGCCLIPLAEYHTRMVLIESYPLQDEAFSAFRRFIFPRVDPYTNRVNEAYAEDIASVGHRFGRDLRSSVQMDSPPGAGGMMPPGGMPPGGVPPGGMPPRGMPPHAMPPGGMSHTQMPRGSPKPRPSQDDDDFSGGLDEAAFGYKYSQNGQRF
mmetsp:Transcript_403/g.937  ORF Transcript_403/g.937 Transcript_403/m.937 type:complete len:676 (-) Transcript_403:122-2149(-)|eukprot:CAMPEP_0171493008 /NCGR_PEP_ID=MMETSP0958-20121227/4731_1 /TAXON_ID=87120 /ORGANISM="Aurantiochytrium limacinum, Strain ATCCMYA-1381" /LENGTH=675 /DNA_ID=CAMNT_0012026599 /DNA_START=226 /DNA_END=2253 /DNA_ORIENTATION=+